MCAASNGDFDDMLRSTQPLPLLRRDMAGQDAPRLHSRVQLAKRKVMASMQRRKGPNVVGVFGLFQPMADGPKLAVKEPVLPSSANVITFLVAPLLTFL